MSAASDRRTAVLIVVVGFLGSIATFVGLAAVSGWMIDQADQKHDQIQVE